ncbi:MAG: osmotically inducible protein C [Candidatus Latescibacteria bacterium]|nr:osmotically inducible protein C [Candidatus Latescibacterota bacterium]
MAKEFRIRFEGKARVVAEVDGGEIATDQSVEAGGEGSAPEPLLLFFASIGTCAGINVRRFCETRGIPTEGIHLTQSLIGDPEKPGRVGTIRIEIHLPHEFPEKYRPAVVRAANGCAVKRTLQDPCRIEVETTPAS